MYLRKEENSGVSLSLSVSLSLLECEAAGQSLPVQRLSLSFAVVPY